MRCHLSHSAWILPKMWLIRFPLPIMFCWGKMSSLSKTIPATWTSSGISISVASRTKLSPAETSPICDILRHSAAKKTSPQAESTTKRNRDKRSSFLGAHASCVLRGASCHAIFLLGHPGIRQDAGCPTRRMRALPCPTRRMRRSHVPHARCVSSHEGKSRAMRLHSPSFVVKNLRNSAPICG